MAPPLAAGLAAAGVLAGTTYPGLATGSAIATAASVVVATASALLRRPALAVSVGLLAVLLSSAAATAWRTSSIESRMLPSLADDRASVRVCGTALHERPASVEIEVRYLESGDQAWAVREPALLVGDERPPVRAGQSVCLNGTVRLPSRGDGEAVFLVASEAESQGLGSPIRRAAGVVRDRFRDRAVAALPQEQAGLLLGMTTGDRSLLDEDTVEAFRTTGLAHLVAVSGFHVAVVLGLVGLGVRALVRRGRWLRVAVTAPPLIFFAFLVGLTPSVLRATVTAGIVLAVVASGRTSEGLRTACAAFVVLLYASPDLLFRPAFQMSFGATFGLILWAGTLSDGLARLWRPRWGRNQAKAASVVIGTAAAAQLGVAPFLAAHFGQIPAAGGLANLIAVPLAPLVVGGGLVTLTLSSVWGALGPAPALVLLPIDVILLVARRFAGLPGASFDAGLPAAAAITAAGAALLARSRGPRVVAAAACIVLLAATGGRMVAERTLSCQGPHVRAIDIGGTAVLLTDGEHAVLGDGGPAGRDVVGQLRAIGVRRLDMIIASHPHADHTEGLVEALGSMDVEAILAPPNIWWGTGRDLVDASQNSGVPLIHGTAGQTYEIGGIRLEVLSPDDRPLPRQDPGLINRYNLVVRAHIGETTVLLPGDADGLLQMLLSPGDIEAGILVAPHHGSADLESSFVEAVSPSLTLVTVDPANPYGHPSPVAMAIYETHGAVFSTDRHGHVVACPGSEGIEVKTAR